MAKSENVAQSQPGQGALRSKGEASEQFPPLKNEQEVRAILEQLGLGDKISSSSKLSRSGVPLVDLRGPNARDGIILDPAMLKVILGPEKKQANNVLFSALENCFPKLKEGDVDARDLLRLEPFQNASLSSVGPVQERGNPVLAQVAKLPPETLACFYGSTSGLNFAEVLETAICADQSARKLGREVEVVFDHSDHESPRSFAILNRSVGILPKGLQSDFDTFLKGLGATLEQARLNAAQELLGRSVNFVAGKEIFKAMEGNFSLAKLALLGKLGRGDQTLFTQGEFQFKVHDLIRGVKLAGHNVDLERDVSSVDAKLGGFTYYARDAVMAADFPGTFITPLKMTTHANIYKILGRYDGALYGQIPDRGTILCPILKHRIQTAANIKERSGDPFEVTTLAFLAKKFPDNYQRLLTAFNNSCQVLSPSEAIHLSHGSKGEMLERRFAVEDYFPELTEGRRVSIL